MTINTTFEVQIEGDCWLIVVNNERRVLGHIKDGQTTIDEDTTDLKEEHIYSLIEAAIN